MDWFLYDIGLRHERVNTLNIRIQIWLRESVFVKIKYTQVQV